MPMKYRKIFAHEDIIVPCRLRKYGVYEARVRRKDLHIEVSARDFAALKEKFIRAPPTRGRSPRPSNGYCPITMFTNCAIHMSAAAKSAAWPAKSSASGWGIP